MDITTRYAELRALHLVKQQICPVCGNTMPIEHHRRWNDGKTVSDIVFPVYRCHGWRYALAPTAPYIEYFKVTG